MFSNNAAGLFAPLTIGFILVVFVSTTAFNIQIYGQSENETNQKMNMTAGGTLPSLSTPGEKTFYIFTSEIENVNEAKEKVPGDSFSVHTIVVNKGDKVTIHFYNVDEAKTERHSFSIGDPYKVDIDVGFAQNGNATLTADHPGIFTYYCKYHLPVMTGQLVVVP